MARITPPTFQFSGSRLAPQVAGLERLGIYRFESALSPTPIIPIPPRDTLTIVILISSLTAAALPTLRFGNTGDTIDSGATYWHRNMESAAQGDLVNSNFNNTGTPSTSSIHLGFSAQTAARIIYITANTMQGGNKTFQWSHVRATGAAATTGLVASGWGEWFNTGPIMSVQMGLSAAASFNARSRIAIFGKSFL
jgi:hypothetical protein